MMNKKLTASLLCAFLLLPAENSLAISNKRAAMTGIPALIATIGAVYKNLDAIKLEIEKLSQQFSENPEGYIKAALTATIGAGVALGGYKYRKGKKNPKPTKTASTPAAPNPERSPTPPPAQEPPAAPNAERSATPPAAEIPNSDAAVND